MTETILQTKKNGMFVLLLVLLGYIIAAAARWWRISWPTCTGCWAGRSWW